MMVKTICPGIGISIILGNVNLHGRWLLHLLYQIGSISRIVIDF